MAKGFFGIDNELLLILLFIAIFSGGTGFLTQGGIGNIFGAGRDENLIFFIILLLLFTGGFGFGDHGIIEE